MMASCYDGVEDNLAGGNTMEQAVDSVSNISTAAGLLITAQEQLIDKREHKYQYQFNLHICVCPITLVDASTRHLK